MSNTRSLMSRVAGEKVGPPRDDDEEKGAQLQSLNVPSLFRNHALPFLHAQAALGKMHDIEGSIEATERQNSTVSLEITEVAFGSRDEFISLCYS